MQLQDFTDIFAWSLFICLFILSISHASNILKNSIVHMEKDWTQPLAVLCEKGFLEISQIVKKTPVPENLY